MSSFVYFTLDTFNVLYPIIISRNNLYISLIKYVKRLVHLTEKWLIFDHTHPLTFVVVVIFIIFLICGHIHHVNIRRCQFFGHVH